MKRKLTTEQVKEIKSKYFNSDSKITQKKLALRYNVSKSCINNLLADKTYIKNFY